MWSLGLDLSHLLITECPQKKYETILEQLQRKEQQLLQDLTAQDRPPVQKYLDSEKQLRKELETLQRVLEIFSRFKTKNGEEFRQEYERIEREETFEKMQLQLLEKKRGYREEGVVDWALIPEEIIKGLLLVTAYACDQRAIRSLILHRYCQEPVNLVRGMMGLKSELEIKKVVLDLLAFSMGVPLLYLGTWKSLRAAKNVNDLNPLASPFSVLKKDERDFFYLLAFFAIFQKLDIAVKNDCIAPFLGLSRRSPNLLPSFPLVFEQNERNFFYLLAFFAILQRLDVAVKNDSTAPFFGCRAKSGDRISNPENGLS